MKNVFPSEWRTQTKWKRRFYSRYMRTLERAGYVLVAGVFAAFVFAFNYRVEDLVTADKVTIEPFASPLVAKGPTLVVRTLASDFDAVRKGQPLLEVVVGDDAVRRYGDWKTVDDLAKRVGPSEEIERLRAACPKPALATLTAPADGTFRLDAKDPSVVPQDKPLGRVVDYNDLRLSASLSGETVADARAGQPARISSIVVEPEAGTLFRGSDAISGRLLQDRVKTVLEKDLVGRGVRLRDDVPLEIKEVSEVQVDASSPLVPGGDAQRAVALDPPNDLRIGAQVLEGHPEATVQVADLPSSVAADAREAVRTSVRGRSVRGFDGKIATLQGVNGVRMVAKLKAGPTSKADPSPVSGTMLSRSFEAQLKVTTPPPFLIEAVREADRAGKAVTARVELVSGSRPIALRLLKKS